MTWNLASKMPRLPSKIPAKRKRLVVTTPGWTEFAVISTPSSYKRFII